MTKTWDSSWKNCEFLYAVFKWDYPKLMATFLHKLGWSLGRVGSHLWLQSRLDVIQDTNHWQFQPRAPTLITSKWANWLFQRFVDDQLADSLLSPDHSEYSVHHAVLEILGTLKWPQNEGAGSCEIHGKTRVNLIKPETIWFLDIQIYRIRWKRRDRTLIACHLRGHCWILFSSLIGYYFSHFRMM